MGKKAVAFRVKSATVAGFELACGRCPIVIQLTHDKNELFPKHRCGGQTRDFDIVLELEAPVIFPSRIDPYWKAN